MWAMLMLPVRLMDDMIWMKFDELTVIRTATMMMIDDSNKNQMSRFWFKSLLRDDGRCESEEEEENSGTGTTKIPLTAWDPWWRRSGEMKIWRPWAYCVACSGLALGPIWRPASAECAECAYNNLGTEARLMVQQAEQQSHCGCPSHSKSSKS